MTAPPGLKAGRGFTLLETIVAMAILALGMLGAMTSLLAAQQQVSRGQTRQFRALLIDASAQRWSAGSKYVSAGNPQGIVASPLLLGINGTNVLSDISNCGGSLCTNKAIGAAPWVPDPTPVFPNPPTPATVPLDLSTGAYFTVGTNGELVQITNTTTPYSIPIGTNCATAMGLVPNLYCREMLVTSSTTGTKYGPVSVSNRQPTSFPPALNNLVTASNTVITLWLRVSTSDNLSSPATSFSIAMNYVL